MDFTHPTARLPHGQRVYAVGDIHGMSDLLAATFARIDADLQARPIADATEIYLGDFIDRGPDSAGVLTMLAARQRQRRVICLLGNHEVFLTKAMDDEAFFWRWMEYGGREALQSYGIEPPATRSRVAAAQADLRAHLPAADCDFIARLAPYHRQGDYLFVHAGIRPGVPLERQTLDDLTFIRDAFLNSTADHGAVVVHGHTPVDVPEVRLNRIGIDTGAYLGGALTCLAIDAETMRFLE